MSALKGKLPPSKWKIEKENGGKGQSSSSSRNSSGEQEKGRKSVFNEKQERLMEMVTKKKECDKKAQDIVLRLIETEEGMDASFLLKNAIHIGPPHWNDVVEERQLSGVCGWVLCQKKLDPSVSRRKQKYVIRGQKVLDITHRKAFCSSHCYARSTHFKKQLLTSPLWMRDMEVEDVTFEILDDDTELHGISVNIKGLKLDEDEDGSDEDEESEKEGGE